MNAPATCDFSTQSDVSVVAPALKAPSLRVVTPRIPKSNDDANKIDPVVPMNSLARLILRRKDELDATWQELAKRGGFSSHTILYALAHKAEHRQVPRPETLERLAKAIDVPLDVVKATAAEAAGYNLQDVNVTLESAEDVRVVAQVMGEISAADRAKLRRLALAFRDEVRESKSQSK